MGLFDGFGGSGNYAAPLMQMQQQPGQPSYPQDGTNLSANLTSLSQMPMNFSGLPQIMQPPQSVPTTPAQMPQPVPPQVGTGTFATNGTASAQPAQPVEPAIGGTFSRPIFPKV